MTHSENADWLFMKYVIVSGNCSIDIAKITGMTPAWLTLIGM